MKSLALLAEFVKALSPDIMPCVCIDSEERARRVSQARTNKADDFRRAQMQQSVAESSSASEEEAETEAVMLPLIVQADVHVRSQSKPPLPPPLPPPPPLAPGQQSRFHLYGMHDPHLALLAHHFYFFA